MSDLIAGRRRDELKADAFPAANQIAQAMAWLRQYVGEGVKCELRWDRSGKQEFPLLAKGDWSALAIFGQYGHFELSAKGAINLPIESLGFGYRIDGDDVTFTLDPVTFKGLAGKLGSHEPEQPSQAVGEMPAQFGVMSLLSILSVVRAVFMLLNPKCDLILGGNISLTVVLTGDRIEVSFQQTPQVRVVALWTSVLSIEHAVIIPTNIRLDFGGGWFIKSRDFAVE